LGLDGSVCLRRNSAGCTGADLGGVGRLAGGAFFVVVFLGCVIQLTLPFQSLIFTLAKNNPEYIIYFLSPRVGKNSAQVLVVIYLLFVFK
jgi:hypothetical protein